MDRPETLRDTIAQMAAHERVLHRPRRPARRVDWCEESLHRLDSEMQRRAATECNKALLARELARLDASYIPGARLRNGSLHVPYGQHEAANREMVRIGAPVRFG